MMHITMFVALVTTVWVMFNVGAMTSWLSAYLKITMVDEVQSRLTENDLMNGYRAIAEYYTLTRRVFPIALAIFANLGFVWYAFAAGIELHFAYLAIVAASVAGGLAWWTTTEFYEQWKVDWSDRVAIAHTETAIDQLQARLVEVSEILSGPAILSDVQKNELTYHGQLIIKAILALKQHLIDLRSRPGEIDLD